MCYPEKIDKYTSLIKDTIGDKNIDSYILNEGWIERKNGRDIVGNKSKYQEEIKDGYLTITVVNPTTDWHEWIKTLGDINFNFTVEPIENGYVVRLPASVDKTSEVKYFKQVFHKAAYCVGCRVCETN